MLLIAGIMMGYVASSAISLLNFFATAEGVHSYMVWGMGNFGGVSLEQLPWFAAFTSLGLLMSILLIKPLNALLLGRTLRGEPWSERASYAQHVVGGYGNPDGCGHGFLRSGVVHRVGRAARGPVVAGHVEP